MPWCSVRSGRVRQQHLTEMLAPQPGGGARGSVARRWAGSGTAFRLGADEEIAPNSVAAHACHGTRDLRTGEMFAGDAGPAEIAGCRRAPAKFSSSSRGDGSLPPRVSGVAPRPQSPIRAGRILLWCQRASLLVNCIFPPVGGAGAADGSQPEVAGMIPTGHFPPICAPRIKWHRGSRFQRTRRSG